MGIFRKNKKKHPASKGGIAVATAFVSALSGTPAHADNQYQQAVEMTPEIQQQMDHQKVPEFLAETMFKRIPNSKDIIRAFNGEGIDYYKISYIMNPTDDTWAERGVINNMGPLKLGMEDIQKPEYWVLLKLGYKNIDKRGLGGYTSDFNDLSGNIKNQGVFHMAKALNDNLKGGTLTVKQSLQQEKEREEHLLKALYIGATGSENGVEPILNGQYQQMPEVKNLVQEWEEKYDYSPFDKYEDNALLAYLATTITNKAPKNPQLTGLSLFLLVDYFQEKNDTESNIYSRTYNSMKKTPEYRYMNDNRIHLSFEIFN